MKKLIYILIAFAFVGCDDFLDTDSKDLIIPKSVDQYSDLLFGEAHIKDDIMSMIKVMTDDIKPFENSFTPVSSSATDEVFGYYTWQQEPERDKTGNLQNDETWPRLYKSIVICNTIINDYEDITGDISEKEYLKAEAHFFRALDYFYLVNLYAPEYSPENLNKGGVPINDESIIQDKTYTRNTFQEVYEKIIQDLETAEKLLETATFEKTIYNVNHASLYQLFSRVYLYMKEYDKVIDYSNLSLQHNDDLVDLKTSVSEVFNNENAEINFCHLSGFSRYPANPNSHMYVLVASDELINSYLPEDLRLTQFFNELMPSGTKYTNKTSRFNIFNNCFRVAEVYLNRAEAYAEMENYTKCVEDLNVLREKRISASYEVSASNKAEAVSLVRAERRRELCFELHRWFDLRRWDKPSITHDILNQDGTVTTYQLNENDDAYTLPLPVETKIKNPEMQDYPNPVRTPIN